MKDLEVSTATPYLSPERKRCSLERNPSVTRPNTSGTSETPLFPRISLSLTRVPSLLEPASSQKIDVPPIRQTPGDQPGPSSSRASLAPAPRPAELEGPLLPRISLSFRRVSSLLMPTSSQEMDVPPVRQTMGDQPGQSTSRASLATVPGPAEHEGPSISRASLTQVTSVIAPTSSETINIPPIREILGDRPIPGPSRASLAPTPGFEGPSTSRASLTRVASVIEPTSSQKTDAPDCEKPGDQQGTSPSRAPTPAELEILPAPVEDESASLFPVPEQPIPPVATKEASSKKGIIRKFYRSLPCVGQRKKKEKKAKVAKVVLEPPVEEDTTSTEETTDGGGNES